MDSVKDYSTSARVLGKKLQLIRMERELEQKDLSDLLGFKNYQQISKWETGKSMPDLKHLLAISNKLRFNFLAYLGEWYEKLPANSSPVSGATSKNASSADAQVKNYGAAYRDRIGKTKKLPKSDKNESGSPRKKGK